MPKRILIVDDLEDNRHILMYRLHRMGAFEIREASHGQQVLDLLAQEPSPDLIFMDLRMPVLDGWETIRRIRSMAGPVRDVPIIAVTAQAMMGEEEQARAAGCDDYITKPIPGPRVLREKVARWLCKGQIP